MSQQAIQLCRKAGRLNLSSCLRRGNVISLPDSGRVIVAGDLHGHRRNFERILTYADPERHPDTFIILQEIIHGGPEDDYGGCLSYQLLLDALEWKVRFPEQIHILLGNHDTAAITNTSVLKSGKEMNLAMKTAMRRQYLGRFEDVEAAMLEYLMSQPLAIRCGNRIWISHSLPSDCSADEFDLGVFDRPYDKKDIERPNPVYQLTWGRRHSQETLVRLAERLDVDVFILGHQPQDTGWDLAGENLLIIASEHDHGCILAFDLSRTYTAQQLVQGIVPLAAIA